MVTGAFVTFLLLNEATVKIIINQLIVAAFQSRNTICALVTCGFPFIWASTEVA
jgi:hypothetical protein